MSANTARVAHARSKMWSAELETVLRQPRTPQQQAHLGALLGEAQSALTDLLATIEAYSEGLQDAASACRRDGLPVPAACRDANAMASVARTLLSSVEA